MAAGTLYTYKDSFRANKILISAQYSGAKVDVAPNFTLGETNKSENFLKKFPVGKVPAFEASDGTCIFESNAIAYYVANNQLRGETASNAALIQQFINFADNEILPSAATWVFPTYGIMQYNKNASDKAMDEIKKCLTFLNNHLLTRTYLVGERITLADITVACNMVMLYKQVLEPSFREPYGNVNRWFTTLINQPEFKNVLGEVTLCEKMATFDAAKFAELHPKKHAKHGHGHGHKHGHKAAANHDKQEKQEKQGKKEKPKKEEKKEKQPEEQVKEAPKKDPFADLPKTDFDMDAWKREYSNKDTTTEAIPYFWEHFDKENMSLWHAEYKYPDELDKVFMACNLVGGMLQRLDKLRKIGFGSVLIFGKDKDCSISGVWLFRGHTLGFELSEDFQIDSPSYDFRKLDPDNQKDKELFNAYLAWEGDFGGKEVNQGKVFK